MIAGTQQNAELQAQVAELHNQLGHARQQIEHEKQNTAAAANTANLALRELREFKQYFENAYQVQMTSALQALAKQTGHRDIFGTPQR
jgi:hypothetical protein